MQVLEVLAVAHTLAASLHYLPAVAAGGRLVAYLRVLHQGA